MNQYFVKMLDERFDRMHERFDHVEKRIDQRERDVNLMDTLNKAEIKAVKDRVIVVETQISNVRLLLRVAMWLLVTVGGLITWSLGVFSHIIDIAKKVA